MLKHLNTWYQRYFSHEEAVLMVMLIAIAGLIVFFLGRLLAPVFTAIVLAYLMQGLVTFLIRQKVPNLLAVISVYALFLGLLGILLVVLLPLAWSQLIKMINEQIPKMMEEMKELMQRLPEKYPEFISQDQVAEWVVQGQDSLGSMGQSLISTSITNLPTLLYVMVFIVLVPVLVFFLLKDKNLLIGKFVNWLPSQRQVLIQVWNEMNKQVSNYVRGKAIEIFIVGGVTYSFFALMGLNYAELLGVFVGLSVLVPYIGAAVVTVPVTLAAYFQFGTGPDFIKLFVVYSIIQALDGNVLVPLLFSEVVNLHPVSIIVAVLIFGGLWGLWGVFFAIPLATLIKAIINAWPRGQRLDVSEGLE